MLVGPSGAGKSTFAQRHFRASQVISSDELRAALADDPNDQAASAEAFHILTLLVNGRLRRRLLTIVDATNLRSSSRRRWVRIAERYDVPAVAVCFDFAAQAYLELNRRRPARQVEEEVVRAQVERVARAMADLPAEGYQAIHLFHSPEEVIAAEVQVSG